MPAAAPLRDQRASTAEYNRTQRPAKLEAEAQQRVDEGRAADLDAAREELLREEKEAAAQRNAKNHALACPDGGSMYAPGPAAARGGPNTVAFALAQQAQQQAAQLRVETARRATYGALEF